MMDSSHASLVSRVRSRNCRLSSIGSSVTRERDVITGNTFILVKGKGEMTMSVLHNQVGLP